MTRPLPSPTVIAAAALVPVALVLGLTAGLDPKVALTGAFGAVFVVVVVSDLGAGLAMFTLISFLEVVPDIGGAGVGITKVAGLLLALAWVASTATRPRDTKDFFSSHPGLTALIALLLAWSLVSALWAERDAGAFDATYRYGLNLALFPIAFGAIRQDRNAIWVVGAFVAGSIVAALYGVFSRPAIVEDLDRLTGTIGDPNELAAVLLAGGILAVGLAATLRRESVGRLIALAASGLCLLAMFLTLSRGGLVALAAALVAAMFVAGAYRGRVVALAAIAAISAVTYFGVLASSDAVERITTADGGAGRTTIWEVGWRMVEANPVVGVGAGNFQTSSIHYLLEPGALLRDEFVIDASVAHNAYLETLAEIGIIGLALFLLILILSLGCTLRAARRFAEAGNRRMDALARALLIASIAVLAADFFLSDQYSKQLWLLLALGPAMLGLATKQAGEVSRR